MGSDPGLAASLPPSSRLVFDGDIACIGVVRCSPRARDFAEPCTAKCYCFAFPRSTVRIRPARRVPFVEDPTVVSFYNAGQEYGRQMLSNEGDRCEWFGVAPEIVRDAVRGFDPAAADTDELFRHSAAPAPASLYLTQRLLFARVRRGEASELEIEERVIDLLNRAVSIVYGDLAGGRGPHRRRARDIADAALSELARRCSSAPTLSGLAASVGVSVFQLCRAFRSVRGTSIHRWVIDLRVRRALESLGPGADIGDLAVSLGFNHHSHFTAAFRRHFGATPSAVRSMLGRRLRPRPFPSSRAPGPDPDGSEAGSAERRRFLITHARAGSLRLSANRRLGLCAGRRAQTRGGEMK